MEEYQSYENDALVLPFLGREEIQGKVGSGTRKEEFPRDSVPSFLGCLYDSPQ